MSLHTPPPPGGPKRKPWKKSDLPGHHKPGHGAPKESKVDKAKKALGAVGGVVKAVSDGVEKVKLGDVASAAGTKVGDIRRNHKRKLLSALIVAGGLLGAKAGIMTYEHRQDTVAAEATEQAREAPHEHISVPLTMGIEKGQPSVEWKSGVIADACGESHVMTVTPPAYDASEHPAPGTAISLRKGRMQLPKGSLKITVTAHGQKLTYESDADIVIDDEARDYSIDATLTKSEPAP